MHPFVSRLALALAIAAGVACSEPGDTGRGEGVVLQTHADGRIVIEHGEISGIMKAMTMEFEIDPDLLAGIDSGDRVAFTIQAEGGRYQVTSIEEKAPGR